jgi:hypothetical protein
MSREKSRDRIKWFYCIYAYLMAILTEQQNEKPILKIVQYNERAWLFFHLEGSPHKEV